MLCSLMIIFFVLFRRAKIMTIMAETAIAIVAHDAIMRAREVPPVVGS